MKKNGYISVTILKSVDGVKEGDEVMVSSDEFGTMPDDDSLITCYTKDGKEIPISKINLKVNIDTKSEKK